MGLMKHRSGVPEKDGRPSQCPSPGQHDSDYLREGDSVRPCQIDDNQSKRSPRKPVKCGRADVVFELKLELAGR